MRHRTALLLVVLALGVAACGGDDDDGSSVGEGLVETTEEPSAVSKEEYIEQADRICQEGNEAFQRINDELDAIGGVSVSQQLAEAEPLLRQVAALIDDGLAEFRALTPPPGDEEVVDRYLDGVEDQRAYLEQMADAAAAEDLEEFQRTAERLQPLAEERREIAQSYGFQACGAE